MLDTIFSPLGLIILVLAIVVISAFARRNRRPTEEFSPVHKGKAHVGGCKFDRRLAALPLKAPKIDTTNLPAPDARVKQALANVSEAVVRDRLNQLSGEVDTRVRGKVVKIASRNSHHKDIDVAMTWLEEFYASIGMTAVRVPYQVRGKTYFNLVAELPGKVNPEKIVIVSGHLDATVGSPWSSESVAPGADDDGSGTIAVTEVARALKDLPLAYTVRFVHFTGEEQGLWGSYKYSDKCAAEKADILGVFQMDMVGYCALPGNRVDIHDTEDKNGSHELVVALVRAVAQYGLSLNAVDTHNHAVDDRSDHAGFLDHGWKAVLISEEFSDQGFNPNYHRRS
ncbi:MAG TPA: M28 family metallopeptidase, partial [Candidatus Obscuribacterales bacterium]